MQVKNLKFLNKEKNMRRTFLSRFVVLVVCTFILQGASLFLQPSLADAVETTPPPKPNIILINVDNMGWGDLCSNVSGDVIKPDWCKTSPTGTPNLDTLATGGVRLTNFYTPVPICTPSRAALLTGRDPRRYGILSTPPGNNGINELPGSEWTLAETLKKLGYNTAIIGKWQLGFEDGRHSWNQGFEYNYVLPMGIHYGSTGFCLGENYNNGTPYWQHINGTLKDDTNTINFGDTQRFGNTCPVGPGDKEWTAFHSGKSLTEKLTNKAIQYINNQVLFDSDTVSTTPNTVRNMNNPFFIYLAYPAPHSTVFVHVPPDQSIENCPSSSPCNATEAHDQCITACRNDKNLNNNDKKIDCVHECELDTLYSYAIREIDTQVEKLRKCLDGTLDVNDDEIINDLDCHKISPNTIIIFTSDNGPFMGHNAEYNPYRAGRSGGMRGGQKFSYEGGVRVPFIAQWPLGNWNGGGNNTLGQLADMRDIFPTLIRAALTNSGLCSTDDCVKNGAYANDASRIQFTGIDGKAVDIIVDGKDISGVLKNGTTSTVVQKNIQISWFGNFPICVDWEAPGVCNKKCTSPNGICDYTCKNVDADGKCAGLPGYEPSHPFAIRSNVTLNLPNTVIDNYKLYFRRNDLFNVNLPEELYNLSVNLQETELGNLCKIGTVNYCLGCSINNATNTATCPQELGTYKTIVERLWTRSNLYQDNVKNNKCQGALCP
jgi:arylsulfatase A-like enzyme